MAVYRLRFLGLVWRSERPPERFAEFLALDRPELVAEQLIEDLPFPQKNHCRVGGGISSV
jgi:hypothetical protein